MAQVQQSYRILLGHKCCGNLLKCKNAESLKTATKIPVGSYVCLRDVQLRNFLSISTNSLGLLSISTFINSTQADSYQYQLNLSCSNQLINSISTFIPKLLSSLKNLYFKLFCKEIVMLSWSSEY